jgi:D-tagatose-1,6-bisphosphate aldolase subunit GatZ/KbaZ
MPSNVSASSLTAVLQGGIYSVCSAHPVVLEAAILEGLRTGQTVLIEATCNQVNQEGGYTGMTPANFRDRVLAIASRLEFPTQRLILGGDHLGPHPWVKLDAAAAMQRAEEMVRHYAEAGFRKIHLDASMSCADDVLSLSAETVARRAAQLCRAAEEACPDVCVYVIGTEVPTPGGATEVLSHVDVTSAASADEAVESHREAFRSAGLDHVWPRVIALVVQPGLEFGHDSVVTYVPEIATHLAALLKCHPGLVYEAHSTDYQLPAAYGKLMRDGFRIQKVGPALTFALRQALSALARIEGEIPDLAQRSELLDVLERAMLADDRFWKSHYHGANTEQHLLRFFSYSDRIRYYWTVPEVQASVDLLLDNLGDVVPQMLLCEYLPVQYARVRAGEIDATPISILRDAVTLALRPYSDAVADARLYDPESAAVSS